MDEMQMIPVTRIHAGDHAQRLDEDDDAIAELAGSISRIGLLDPLCVTKVDDGFLLVAGHRRLEACKRIGMDHVRCLVAVGDEVTRREITFAENFFRLDLTPIELAVAIANEFKEKRMTIEQLAAGFRKTTDWVRRQIAICGWPEDVLEGMHTGKLSVAAASNLACITEDYYRGMLVRQAVDNGATARTTSAWLQAWRAMLPPEKAIEQDLEDPDAPAVPMVPQAPCLVCHEVFRSDELSHVPLCSHCIKILATAGMQSKS